MSQRASSSANVDPISQRTIRKSCIDDDNNDDDDIRNRNLHARVESPLDSILGSIRLARSRGNQNSSPHFITNESTYGTNQIALSDLSDMDPNNPTSCLRPDSTDSQKSWIYSSQNHPSNNSTTHCSGSQRTLLSGDSSSSSYVQHLVNPDHHQQQYHLQQQQQHQGNNESNNVLVVVSGRNNIREYTIDDGRRRINHRSPSPTSSSDATEHLTSPRQQIRYKQHSHRHRRIKDSHLYQGTLNSSSSGGHQLTTGTNRLENQENICHRYHEIGQPTSCSPVCDSGLRDDDTTSPLNHRERLPSCEDITSCTITTIPSSQPLTTTTTLSSSSSPVINNNNNPSVNNNLMSPLPIVTVANYHHRASSGISCESSTSSSRNHPPFDNCMTRNINRHNHVIQPYALDNSQQQQQQQQQRIQIAHARENKSPLLIGRIGFEAIQISSTPSKNKCQCHINHAQQQQQQQQQQQLQLQHHQQEQFQLQQQQHQSHQKQNIQNHHNHSHHHHYHQHQQYNQDKRGPDENNDGNLNVATSRIHQPPALPPRPPPRLNRRYETDYDSRGDNVNNARYFFCKKYVVLCCLCGGLSAAVGILFLAVHAILSAHTASLALFETVPSYIPGTMLILMGLCTMLLARRKHRYGILMKICGSVGVVCALVCVLVTITTTVIHMSRLQSLRECVYTAKARLCTCFVSSSKKLSDPEVLFEGTPHCEVVHGALYACLRALFGVSVAGILACIFSCMLVYQLLSHEKKKMYWEQLELRCRSLYGHGGGGQVGGAPAGSCGCCNDCSGVNPWWAQTPGNLYTPNPDLAPSRRWRLPWSRSRGPAPTPDSNYGFHAQSIRHNADVNDQTRDNITTSTTTTTVQTPFGYIDSRQQNTPYSVLNPQNTSYTPSNASYSVLETPIPLWGPPPPYSDPNSPARRPHIIIEPKITSSTGSTTSSTPAPIVAASPSLQPLSRINTIKRTIDPTIINNEDHHGQRGTMQQHCTSSDNYENTEDIIINPDPECITHEGVALKSGRRSRRALKGVENDGFQKESNHQMNVNKQSESELYFGDVSSCCGPESSLYELAVDKELTSEVDTQQQHQQQQQQQQQPQDYPSTRINKLRLSKRSRLPLPLPPSNQESPHQDLIIDSSNERNYRNNEEAINSTGAFLAPDAQYEVIQQGARYGYYLEDSFRESSNNYSFYTRDNNDTDLNNHDYRTIIQNHDHDHVERVGDDQHDGIHDDDDDDDDDDNDNNVNINERINNSNLNSTPGKSSQIADDDLINHEKLNVRRDHQCCSNNDLLIRQNVEKSDDGVCPINV